MRTSITSSVAVACLVALGSFVHPVNAQVKTQSLSNASWTQIGGSIDGRVSGRGQSLAVDANGVIYYGTARGGLWKTTDKGQNWVLLSGAWASQAIGGVAVDPKNPKVIYGGTGCPPDANGADYVSGVGIYKSSDGGVTWVLASLNDGFLTYSMIVNPENDSLVYQVSTNGLYRSKDAGKTWSNVCPGVTSLVIDPVDASVLYAGGEYNVLKSTDFGATWDSLSGFALGSTETLAISPANHSKVYLSTGGPNNSTLSVSNDGGNSWSIISKDDIQGSRAFLGDKGQYLNSLTVNPTDADRVIVGAVDLYSLKNNGADMLRLTNWTATNNAPNYIHADVHLVTYANGILYALTEGGIFHSENDGLKWEQDMNAGLNSLMMGGCDMNVDGNGNPRTFVACADDNGFLQLTAGEKNWHTNSTQIIGQCYISVDGQTEYAGGSQLFTKSTNNGSSWVPSFVGDPNYLLMGSGITGFYDFDAADEDRNVVAVCGNDGIYLTKDGFSSIPAGVKAVTGLHTPNFIGLAICVAFAQPSATHLYCGTFGSTIYASTDQGSTWAQTTSTLTGLGGGAPSAIASDATHPDMVYAVGNNFFLSKDGAATFAAPAKNLPPLSYTAVAGINAQVFIGSSQGVLISNDSGVTWNPIMNGMPSVGIAKLKIRGHYLLASTSGSGMYLLDLNQLNGSGAVAQTSVKTPSFEVYPNPVSASDANITVRYTSTSDTRTTITIVDLLGRERKIVAESSASAGDRTVTANLSHLTPGQYFVKLVSGNTSIIKPIIIE